MKTGDSIKIEQRTMKSHYFRQGYVPTLPPLAPMSLIPCKTPGRPVEISWIVLRDLSPPVVTLAHVLLKQPLTMSQRAKSTMINLTRNEVKAVRAAAAYRCGMSLAFGHR